jgi:hypothetical protein
MPTPVGSHKELEGRSLSKKPSSTSNIRQADSVRESPFGAWCTPCNTASLAPWLADADSDYANAPGKSGGGVACRRRLLGPVGRQASGRAVLTAREAPTRHRRYRGHLAVWLGPGRSGPERSQGLCTIPTVNDYAGAWTAERGRCHRFIYREDDGRPADCPGPPVMGGWRRDGQGRWYLIEACDQHASQLLARPPR